MKKLDVTYHPAKVDGFTTTTAHFAGVYVASADEYPDCIMTDGIQFDAVGRSERAVIESLMEKIAVWRGCPAYEVTDLDGVARNRMCYPEDVLAKIVEDERRRAERDATAKAYDDRKKALQAELDEKLGKSHHAYVEGADAIQFFGESTRTGNGRRVTHICGHTFKRRPGKGFNWKSIIAHENQIREFRRRQTETLNNREASYQLAKRTRLLCGLSEFSQAIGPHSPDDVMLHIQLKPAMVAKVIVALREADIDVK